MNLNPEHSIIKEILSEMEAAIEKHPVWPKDNVHRAAIISEEAGEVVREANHLLEGHGDVNLLRKELLQTGATVIRMLMALDKDYELLQVKAATYIEINELDKNKTTFLNKFLK